MILRHLVTWLVASSAYGLTPPSSLEDFRRICHEHRSVELRLIRSPEVGKIEFIPTAVLAANQVRFSYAAVLRKLQGKKGPPGFKYGEKENSFLSEKKVLTGIFYNGQVYVTDGHHRALISTFADSPTTPVRVVEDLTERKFSPEQFEHHMAENYHSYLYDYDGAKMPRVDLCDMIDDPLLELARNLISRVDAKQDADGHFVIETPKTDRPVLGLKTNFDIAYLEFEIADALRRAGVKWDNDRGDKLSKEELKRFLKILKEARKIPGSRLRQVLLFDKIIAEDAIDLAKTVVPHLEELACEAGLKGTRREIQ